MDTLHPLIPLPHLFFLRPYLGWGYDIDAPLWLSTPQTLILRTLICDESLRYLPSTAQRSFSDVGLELHKSVGTDMFIEK